MLVGVRHGHVPDDANVARSIIDGSRFFAIAVGLEAALIIAASVLTGLAYHIAVYGDLGPVLDFAAAGTLTALLFTLPFIFAGRYSIDAFLGGKRGFSELFNAWGYAFLCLAVLGFLTKTTGMMSRGWMLTFFFTGLMCVVQFDALLERWLRRGISAGWVAARRLILIGTAGDIARFKSEHAGDGCGAEVVATALLPENYPENDLDEPYADDDLRRSLASAVDLGRKREVSDVVALIGSHNGRLLSRITDSCMDLPATIHLGRLGAIGHYPGLRIERMGTMTTLALVPSPMSTPQLVAKRAFDLVAASVALAACAPVLAVVAALIKLDDARSGTHGPVFFRQHRRGFNHKQFMIWKFRTMTTMDDGPNVVQAQPDDPRVTRIGRVLRRSNLDELPQLFNVIAGQMSLVGPRPHAVAHDVHFERCIERYARRLNVKPGITGWAQVNGFRGLTETEQDMRNRVACDLHYIDHWSIAFDLYIIAMTVASSRAYRNAG